MRHRGSRASLVRVLVAALLLVTGIVPQAIAQTGEDESDVVIVLDFSASMLRDVANRGRFAAALVAIADRVDETSADLVKGNTTVTLMQFASRAADYPRCNEINLLDSPPNVTRFSECLRSVAGAYRKGIDPALTKKIGVGTNFVAAMQLAATHLPSDAVRPTIILFTDGKLGGDPAANIFSVHDTLFGSRTPFALLPVGMSLDPSTRASFEEFLVRLRIVRDMPDCGTGVPFDWSTVVFNTATDAGNAVAVGLQDATCTFTVAPTPTPTPIPTPASVQGVRLTARDRRIELTWARPASSTLPITDYRIRCRPTTGGDWIESTEGVSLKPSAAVEGLENGIPYECEVMSVSGTKEGAWTAAPGAVTPIGRPTPPGKPSVEALDAAIRVSVPADDSSQVTGRHFECTSSQAGAAQGQLDVTGSALTGQVGSLTNGAEYTCRAFAENANGLSDASPVSDAIKPCGSTLECTPILAPVLGGVGLVLLAGVAGALALLFRSRRRGYVVAVVDVIHTTNLGYGSNLGFEFIRTPGTARPTGIASNRGPTADIHIRRLSGDRFEVVDKAGRRVAASGESTIAADSTGVRHELVLRAFTGASAAAEAERR